MIRRWLACAALLIFLASPARAHLGSPDVFFDGNVGPYPARITIRMPTVVPGRAEIIVQIQSAEPVDVSFLPLYSRTAVSNAPPPDIGQMVRGETNLYSGDLWLMSFGAYSIEVKIHGAAGEGAVEIPVTSVAISQLPLPPYLAKLLVALGALLVFGGLAIVVGAARDSVLPPGALPDNRARWKGRCAGVITLLVAAFLLVGGMRWWGSEERAFRRRLRGGAWPDMELAVRTEGSQRILELTLGKRDFEPSDPVSLIPDHGKLLHLFLIREGTADAIGHVHPVRKEGGTFQVAVPPLPEGRYQIFCDLTLESSGMSFTATNSVQIPALPLAATNTLSLEPDPDDSWAVYPAESVPPATATNAVYVLPDGQRVEWKAHPPLHAHQDAGLRFEVRDAAGNPVLLEPYMGMISHAAVMRRDGTIFAHLHPMGNFSMAAQGFFQAKMARETGAPASDDMAGMPGMAGMNMAGMDHSKMGHMMHNMPASGPSLISIPYEFPAPGEYRIWVQFKTGGQVLTAVFDATVAP